MSRKPLSVRNSENPRKPAGGNPVKKKKIRPNFAILERPTLVSQLNLILKDVISSYGPAKLTEDDIKSPTPERVQMIYFRLLQYSHDVSIDTLTQAPFSSTPSFEHKELMEDFTYRIQFFRAMKRLMLTCLERDFKLTDLISPDPKRFCRHLCGFLNYTKFHLSVFKGDQPTCSLIQTKEELNEEYLVHHAKHQELNKTLVALEKKRREEHDLEEELKAQISSQRHHMHELKSSEEYMKQQYQSLCEDKERSDQKLAMLTKDLDKCSGRVDDLMKQVVTSPDKLRAKLGRLKLAADEALSASKDTKDLHGMWESLASRADQIPGGVLEGVGEKLDALEEKVKTRNDLLRRYDCTEEERIRQEQLLRESTDKQQNLLQHLRMMKEDSNRTAYQEGMMGSQHHDTQELQRKIFELDQHVRQKDVESDKTLLKMEAGERELAEYREVMKEVYLEMEQVTVALVTTFHQKVEEYSKTMKVLGVDCFQN